MYKIYLEPRHIFDVAIERDEEKTIYSYQKILEVLVKDFGAPEEPESYDIADEYFWYNIERLKDFYGIDFDYTEDFV